MNADYPTDYHPMQDRFTDHPDAVLIADPGYGLESGSGGGDTDNGCLPLYNSSSTVCFNPDNTSSSSSGSGVDGGDDGALRPALFLPNHWALALLVFPVFTVFGNVLVVLSVYREKSLQSVTNYFIVSLAIADIMVAILVMPLAVYVEVNKGLWELGDGLCDTWVALDVMCCTASILNLAAISVDRFIAVTQPIKYAKHKNSNRVYVMLALSWIISIAISSPIALGMNYTDRRSQSPYLCTFYNSDFLIYSSMGSFYIPCIVMVLLYWRIFHAIRQRARKAAQKSRASVSVTPNCRVALQPNDRSVAGHTRTVPTAAVGPPPPPPVTTSDATSAAEEIGCRTELIPKKRGPCSHGGEIKMNPIATVLEEASIDPRIRNCAKRISKIGESDEDEEDSPPDEIHVNNGRGTGFHHEADSDNYSPNTISVNSVESRRVGSYWRKDSPSGRRAVYCPPATVQIELRAGDDSPQHDPVKVSFARQQGNPAPRLSSPSSPSAHPVETPTTTTVISRHQSSLPQKTMMMTTTDDNCCPSRRSNVEPDMGVVRTSSSSQGNHHQRCRSPGGTTITKFNFRLRKETAGKKKERSSQSMSHRREKKATKTLAIVLGVFLLCWVPFFTINIMNAICIRYDLFGNGRICQFDASIFSLFVWLGYMNSFLNPVIYTIFNMEFRRAFKNLLMNPCKWR